MLALEHALARQETLETLILSSTLASAAEWVVEAKRLRDAIPIDDEEEAQREFDARHFFRLGEEPEEMRLMQAERGPGRLRGDVGPERVDRAAAPSAAGTCARASAS